MRYLITTPDNVTIEKEVTESDLTYLESLKAKGYIVEKLSTPNVCIACEG